MHRNRRNPSKSSRVHYRPPCLTLHVTKAQTFPRHGIDVGREDLADAKVTLRQARGKEGSFVWAGCLIIDRSR